MTSNGAPARAMDGFPPAPETRVGPHNWFKLPYLRWSLLHRASMLPTATVWRGDGPVSELPAAPQDLGALGVTGLDGEPTTLDPLLERLEADGFLVMHRGRIVYERYLHGMRPQDRHGSASISKSLLGCVAGLLSESGAIDLARTAEHYVPEMRGSAMGDATLRQLMDMEAGIVRPVLAGRPGDIGAQDGGVYEVLGLMPRSADSPTDFCDFILRKPPAGRHGEAFYYDNGQPEAVAWAIRRATGRSIAELMSELLWQPLGAQRDAYYSVDAHAAEFTAGGFACTLRDLARFGEMLRHDGHWNGRRIVPEAFIADVRRGGNREHFAACRFASVFPGGSYRSFFWNPQDAAGSFLGWGRYGQRICVVPSTELVIAQFSAAPGPSPHPFDLPMARLYRELTAAFSPS